MPGFSSRLAGAVAAGLLLCLAATGCDEVPGPTPLDREAPRVTQFAYAPDSVVVADLPPDQVQDSVARVNLDIAAQVQDPDSEIAAVLFTFEPASRPQATAVGTLAVADQDPGSGGQLYGGRAQIGLPATVREIYTLRVYAVDADSLFSNQVTGQVRVIPDE